MPHACEDLGQNVRNAYAPSAVTAQDATDSGRIALQVPFLCGGILSCLGLTVKLAGQQLTPTDSKVSI